VVIIAAELLAVTQIMDFQFPTSYLKEQNYPDETLEWPVGQNTNSAVWVGLFLVVIGAINLLPVKIYGRLEYMFGCLKIIFITGLIMFNVVLNARKK
jgi:amino acid transporter